MPHAPARPRPALTADQRALAEANLGMAYWVAHKFARTAPDKIDDFSDAAIDGLLHAATRYDPKRKNKFNRENKFTTVAGKYARNSILTHLKYISRAGRMPDVAVVSIDAARNPWSEPVVQVCVDDDEAGPGKTFDELTEGLDERLRAVLRMRFVEGMTLADAGREMGVCKERVRQLQARAVEMLRERIGAREED